MGLFDGVLGGIVGGAMASVVNGILEQHGGVPGVVNQFEKNGLGATVRSWWVPARTRQSQRMTCTERSGPICCSSSRQRSACRCRSSRKNSRRCCRRPSIT